MKEAPIISRALCWISTRLVLVVAAHGLAIAAAANAEEKKPNILIIWGDDIGQSNISAGATAC